MTEKKITKQEITEEDSFAILQLQKKVLSAACYGEKLFKKELEKSREWMKKHHFKELLMWAVEKFLSFADKIKRWFQDFFVEKQVSLV